MSEKTKMAKTQDRKRRRPYSPPKIDESAEFETLASGCTFNTGACALGMITTS